MKELLTIEKAVSNFASWDEAFRAEMLASVKREAQTNPDPTTRQTNRLLLAALQAKQAELQRAKRPELPTAAETNAALWYFGGLFVKVVGGAAAVGGGLYFVGSIVYGAGKAFIAGALANSSAIFWGVIGLVGGIVALFAWGNWREASEVEEADKQDGGQTLIVNVFTSQNGDVNVTEQRQ